MKIYAFEHPEAAAELMLKMAVADMLSMLRMLPAIFVLALFAMFVRPAEAATVDYGSRAHACASAIAAMRDVGLGVLATCKPGGVATMVFGASGDAGVVLQVVRRGEGWRIVDAPIGVSCPAEREPGQ